MEVPSHFSDPNSTLTAGRSSPSESAGPPPRLSRPCRRLSTLSKESPDALDLFRPRVSTMILGNRRAGPGPRLGGPRAFLRPGKGGREVADSHARPGQDGRLQRPRASTSASSGSTWQGDTPASTKFVTGRFVLDPGKTPHPPHTHAEEEVMVIESGTRRDRLRRQDDQGRPRLGDVHHPERPPRDRQHGRRRRSSSTSSSGSGKAGRMTDDAPGERPAGRRPPAFADRGQRRARGACPSARRRPSSPPGRRSRPRR